MNLKELLAKKAETQAAMDEAIAPIRAHMEAVMQPFCEAVMDIQRQIDQMVNQRLHELRAMQGKEFGVVHMNVDGVKVSETIAKTITWDQEKLAAIYDRIMIAGDNPLTYMRQKFDVPEKQYSEFPKPVRNIFDEARTVKPGKPSIKFETFE
ncbi:MAG: hypothetical protein HGB02_08765 [Chlorobiaceae bacterium]|nr:hypothetical protein [Chlorobiaceae bacterium]